MTLEKHDELRLSHLLAPLRKDEKVKEMKKYIQHGKITTYDHVESVARVSFFINRRFNLGSDEKALVRGAFLHDFFLYDWHDKDATRDKGLHGFTHANTALKNAKKRFDLNKREENIIDCHMWPLNITKLPRCREAWIVCFADKYVSAKETLFCR